MQRDDRDQIRELYEATTHALGTGDIRTLATYYTNDAIQFPPDRPPLIGWAKIEASLERELSGIVFNSNLDVKQVVVEGDCAYAWGRFQGLITPKFRGASAATSGSFLDVLHRQSDGSWRIACSTWSNHGLEE